jgi:hypothetical protein
MTASLVLLLLLSSCLRYVERRSGASLRDIDAEAAVLKLHLASGEVYVLSEWKANEQAGTISGRGQKWSPARQLLANGQQVVALRDVVIFETSSSHSSIGPNAVFGTLTTASVAVAALVVYIIVLFASDGPSYH